MFMSVLARIERASVATTKQEKEACARFGYEVYVNEMGYTPPGTNHDARVVWDEHDEKENAIHLYAGKLDDIKGIMRLIVWEPGRIDPGFHEAYSMHLFPGIDQMRTGEIGRLMIRPTVRGKLVLPALVRLVFELMASEYQLDLTFAECRPGLVPHYRRLGMRPYRAELTQTPEGFMVPLVDVISDVDYQKSVGSITTGIARKYFGPGKREPLDTTPFANLFDVDNQRIELDAARVWSAIQSEVSRPHLGPTLFDGLNEEDQRVITKGGIILEVSSGADAAVQGRSESEIYIVLEGAFHVLADGEVVTTLGPGEVFGEMAFFRESGARSATVRARNDSKLLVLKRSFFDRLRKDRPEAAFTLLFNLGRILSERLAERLHPISACSE